MTYTSTEPLTFITVRSLEWNTVFSREFFTTNLTTKPGLTSDVDSGLSWVGSIVVAVFSSLVSFVTVFGNLIVIYAFCTTRKLRTYTNFFLISLAVSDIVAGAITMPLYSVYWILGYWPFSDALCDAYLYLNHAFIHISVMSIVIIAYDRWEALETPIKHLQKRTLQHAMFLITISYMVPMLIWLPGCLLWPYLVGKRTIKEGLCYPQYVDNIIFTCFAPCIFFWFPLLFITILYGRIIIIIQRSATTRIGTNRVSKAITMASLARTTSDTVQEVDKDDNERMTDDTCVSSIDISLDVSHGFDNNAYDADDTSNRQRQGGTVQWFRNIFHHNTASASDDIIRRENKRANITLTLIFIAMVISSAPWSALVPVFSICPECIPLALYQVRQR